MINILDLDLDELKIWMNENNEKEFRAKQVFDWIYKGVYDFNSMKNLSKSVKDKLVNTFKCKLPETLEKLKSQRDKTYKFLFRYEDGNIIESVVMNYKYGNSICVSTQVGCKMGCKFCASTLNGVVRSLTCGEILGQILKAEDEIKEKINHVVLMGSGEPLDNFDNVIKFIKLANSKNGLNIGQRHITLSTCGIVPKIKELADKKFQITLAISLHASNNEKRKAIMPIAYKYDIDELINVCKYYIDKTNRRITFEYALVKDVNDRYEDAEELSKLLKGILCNINLIPVNEIKENNFKKSSMANINKFKNTLVKNGIETTIRREMGADINAACGQLRRSYMEEKNKIEEV